MADATLSISIQAQLADFRKELATLPGIGEAEARDMVTGIRRQLKQAERDAAAAASKVGTEFRTQFSGVEGAVKRLGEKMGGTFSTIASLATDGAKDIAKMAGVSEATGLAISGVGTAAAGAALAIGGLIYGAKGLADAALEARDRLVEQGLAAKLPEDALRSLQQYEQASTQLNTAMDQFKVVVGGQLADDLAVLASNVAGVVTWLTDGAGALQGWLDTGLQVVTLGLATPFLEYRDAQKEATLATLDANAAAAGYDDTQRAMLETLGILIPDQEVDEGIKRNIAAATRDQAAAEREHALALEEAQKTHDLVMAVRIQNYRWAYEAAQEAAKKEIAASASVPPAVARDSAKIQQEVEDIKNARIKAAREAEAEEIASSARTVSAYLQVGDQILGNIETILKSTLDSYTARLEAGEQFTAAETKAANAARAAYKAAAITQAGVSAAIVGIGALASLLSNLVPVPVAVVAASTLAATSFGAALASINSSTPPKFEDPTAEGGGSGGVTGPNSSQIAQDEGEAAAADAGFDFGGKGSGHQDQQSRGRGGGGATITLDPRLKRLTVTSDAKAGKRRR